MQINTKDRTIGKIGSKTWNICQHFVVNPWFFYVTLILYIKEVINFGIVSDESFCIFDAKLFLIVFKGLIILRIY